MSAAFEVLVQSTLHMITFRSDIDEETTKELGDHIREANLAQGTTVALDFGKVRTLPIKVYKEFIVIQRLVKMRNSRLVSINLPQFLLTQVRTAGLESIFGVVKNFESLRTENQAAQPKAKSSLDIEFIRPFVESTINIFSVQVGVQLTAGKPYAVKGDSRQDLVGDVLAGTLSIVSENFKGNFCITVTHSAFLLIYEKMFKERPAAVTDDVKDVLAELVNMIYGQAKTVLNDRHGYGILPALPTVLSGSALKVYHSGAGPTICLPFTMNDHTLLVEVSSEK